MADLERLNLLIVESNQGMRSQLRSMLNSFGIANVKFAPSAGAAISRLRDRRFDVILSEYSLGDGQDGQHLLEDLRNKEIIPLDTLFIMITGERNYERVVSAAELAPNDYILKPLTPDMLHMRLLRALEKREIFLPVYRLIEAGETQRAIEVCTTRAETHPRYRIDFLRLEAELHAALGHVEQAEGIYREILAAKVVPWARLGLAKMLFARKDYAGAEEILSALVAESSRYVDAYDWLARTREETGRIEEARDVLTSAVALSPHRLGRLRHLGSVQLTAGDGAAAERTLAEVVRKGKYSDFRDPEDHVHLVRAQLSQGRTDEAQATIRDLESSMGGMAATPVCASLSKALYHTSTGAGDLAQAALQNALQAGAALSSLSTDMKQELVKACLDNHMEAEGSQLVIDILRNAADERTVEKTRAILQERGHGELSNELEERVHVEVRGLISAGADMVKAGDFDGAVREMMAAVQKMPGNPHVLFNAALALLRHIENRGWNERLAAQARGLIARTRRLDPGNPRLDALSGFMQQLVRKYNPRQGG
ncbi:tetratricopeptide repeat-containing response regulator [Aromatoleum evansii]|uniref:tetratricopeptide repeat-containing response regulator n=1 Tax=Aromatoleum evansii TaxID=59406 RepID=UPI00145E0097|nr:tetratricopeptide repeat-containing response regulator [Aromatoleum evansii]NMG28266.1 response regulator [Aromatoleum evansii]